MKAHQASWFARRAVAALLVLGASGAFALGCSFVTGEPASSPRQSSGSIVIPAASEKQCTASIPMPCLSGQVCVHDEVGNCENCACAAPAFTPPNPDLHVSIPESIAAR